MRRFAEIPALLLGLSALAAPLFAERPEASWNRRIGETVAALKANDAAKARETIDGVLDEMSRKANPGKSAGKGLGMALMLRGVSHAALAEERQAVWDWHVAQQLDPALESWDLTEFGHAGALLDRHRWPRDPVPPARLPGEIIAAGGSRPEIAKRGRQPEYLARARERNWQGKIRIEVIVGVDGLPVYPRVSGDTGDEGMVFETSEFVRELTFKPAELAGAPVASTYVLTNSYTQK